MQPKVRPIHDVLKAVENDASDAAWVRDIAREKLLNALADRLRERIAKGEEWEPSF